MPVVTRSKHKLFIQEPQRLSGIEMEPTGDSNAASNETASRPLFTSKIEEQILITLAKEQIKTLSKFGGSEHEDVIIWLNDVEEVFDRARIQPSNKYLAIQSYLVDAALKWFRFNKSKILEWSTFKTAIIQVYQPTLQQTLIKLDKRYQALGESVVEYHGDKLQLCLQADPNMSPSMIVHYLIKGLKDYLIPHVIRRNPITPTDFLVVAQDEEKIFITLKGLSLSSTNDTDNYPTEDNYEESIVGVVQQPTHTNHRSFNRQQHYSSPQPLMNVPTTPYQPPSSFSSRQHSQQRPSSLSPAHHYFQQRPSSLSSGYNSYQQRPSSLSSGYNYSQQRPSSLASRQCYSCYGFGHLATNCPNRKNV